MHENSKGRVYTMQCVQDNHHLKILFVSFEVKSRTAEIRKLIDNYLNNHLNGLGLGFNNSLQPL